MNKAATRRTKNGKEGEDLSAIYAKSARKKTIKSSPNRVHWRPKGCPDSLMKNLCQVPKTTVSLPLQEHKDLLT